MSDITKSKSAIKRLEGYDSGDIERAAGDRWITMSNALTRASHGLTLAEKRIVMMAVSKLDSARSANAQKLTTKITAAEYAELAECTLEAAYQALYSAANNLYNRSITFFEPSFKRGSKQIGDKGTVTRMRWVGRATYQDKEGWVELAWWHEIVPHLMGIKAQFTSYQLKQATALRSIYSWKLLELLMRFESTGVAEYTIEDFCQSMDATEKQKSDFAKIRTKMIEPAVKELEEKDNWEIEVEYKKAGRKVKAIRFKFAKLAQQKFEF